MRIFTLLKRLFNNFIERTEMMTIADQINNIETKVNTLATPTVDLTPVLDAITAAKTEQDVINTNVAAILAKLTATA